MTFFTDGEGGRTGALALLRAARSLSASMPARHSGERRRCAARDAVRNELEATQPPSHLDRHRRPRGDVRPGVPVERDGSAARTPRPLPRRPARNRVGSRISTSCSSTSPRSRVCRWRARSAVRRGGSSTWAAGSSGRSPCSARWRPRSRSPANRPCSSRSQIGAVDQREPRRLPPPVSQRCRPHCDPRPARPRRHEPAQPRVPARPAARAHGVARLAGGCGAGPPGEPRRAHHRRQRGLRWPPTVGRRVGARRAAPLLDLAAGITQRWFAVPSTRWWSARDEGSTVRGAAALLRHASHGVRLLRSR